jgi:hypothetical protein
MTRFVCTPSALLSLIFFGVIIAITIAAREACGQCGQNVDCLLEALGDDSIDIRFDALAGLKNALLTRLLAPADIAKVRKAATGDADLERRQRAAEACWRRAASDKV